MYICTCTIIQLKKATDGAAFDIIPTCLFWSSYVTAKTIPLGNAWFDLHVQTADPEEIQKVCHELAERAYQYSQDPNYPSPHSQEGCQALSWQFCGGKPDDITIILASVVSR